MQKVQPKSKIPNSESGHTAETTNFAYTFTDANQIEHQNYSYVESTITSYPDKESHSEPSTTGAISNQVSKVPSNIKLSHVILQHAQP